MPRITTNPTSITFLLQNQEYPQRDLQDKNHLNFSCCDVFSDLYSIIIESEKNRVSFPYLRKVRV